MGRIFRSQRVAQHQIDRGRDWRNFVYPPPTFQVVRAWPVDCACKNRIAIVGEGPGQDEDHFGVPFVGKSGEELDRYLTDNSVVEPDDSLVTNIGRIYKPGNPDPTPEDIELWTPLLREELNVARPLWIAAIGRISTRYFLGDVDMDAVHGIPFLVALDWLENGRGGRVVVVPVIHPAAGFYSPDEQAKIAYDFTQLQYTINGRLTPRQHETADRYPDPDYRDLTADTADLRLIQESLLGGTIHAPLPVAIDTEGYPGNPWGLSYSTQAGQAFVVRKVHGTALRVFYNALTAGIRAGRLHVVLHNSLHDLRVLRELGIPLPDGSYTDTMVLSYHLCIEPQGLKPLAFRHAGMLMESYDEQVQDAQDRIAVEYYELMEAIAATETVRVDDIILSSVWSCYEDGTGEVIVDEVDIIGQVKVREGGFPLIEPYTILERDKATGQLRQRTKKPHQISTRIKKALKEYRSSKITAAALRNRWDNTDELIVQVVESVIGEMREATLDDVPLERAVRYAARDADATWRVYPVLKERHTAMRMMMVGEIDHDIIPMVDGMQAAGLPVDIPYLKQLSADLERRMIAVQEEIKDTFGVWINPNSGEQVADLLFRPVEEGGYGLKATKQTKGRMDKDTGEMKGKRGSTQDKVLEGLRNDHPIIPLILSYRGLNKAKTSFCDVAIRKAVFEHGQWVVHCNFRITRVSSGRLSATGPNLMAIMGGKLGNEIRNGYIAGTEGWMFSEWDLNQIEMRVMASEANDSFLIDMFIRNEDIHTGTANKMFKLNLPRPFDKKQIDKDKHRDPAKRTGFGVITGIQAPGLVDQMRLQGIIVDEKEAERWIEEWLNACPAVRTYMRKCGDEARQYSYVRDWAGRVRYLPGIHSAFQYMRAEAGRQSHSHKIQGGAQEIMKIAMAKIHRDVVPYWNSKPGHILIPVLQIHDALMFRHKGFSAADMVELDAQIRAAFFSSVPPNFRIPLDAGSGTAAKWGHLEH